MDRLTALVFSDSYTAPVFLDAFEKIADCAISWELPGGTREFTIAVKMSRLAAYEKYRRFSLQRLCLIDQCIDKPISGDIVWLGYGYGLLILTARGPWWRLYDGLENTQAEHGDVTDDVIEQALTDHASGTVNVSDFSHIEVTTAECSQMLPAGTVDAVGGAGNLRVTDAAVDFVVALVQPGDIITDDTGGGWTTITAIEDANNVWVAEAIFVGTDNYTIYRPLVRGTATATLGGWLVDSNAKMLRGYVKAGDGVFNVTDKTRTTTAAVPSGQTTVDITADIMTVDEQYIIGANDLRWRPSYEGFPVADVVSEMVGYGNGAGLPMYFWLQDPHFNGTRAPQKLIPYFEAYNAAADADWLVWRDDLSRAQIARDFTNLATSVTVLFDQSDESTTVTNNTATYWTRDVVLSGRHAIASLADERASVYVGQNSDAVLRRAFTIGAPRISDGSGFRWPLWRMIMEGGGYLRVADAFPDAALVTGGYDRERQGRITTMDYSYRRNLMRVALDDDTRADRRFRDLGFDVAINRRLAQTMVPYR